MPSVPRTGMVDLIAQVRRLIYDKASDTQVFSDTEIQDRLDESRMVADYWLLRPIPFVTGAGTVTYKEFYADFAYTRPTSQLYALNRLTSPGFALMDVDAPRSPIRYWETDLALYNAAWQAMTPDVSEPMQGHWTFSSGVLPPIYIYGKTYDIYAASARLLEEWAALKTDSFDFSTDRMGFKSSQSFRMKLQMAAEYRSRQRIDTIRMHRADADT